MNCGAVIDNNHSGGARKKEATMILKFDGVTGEQLAKLQMFADSNDSLVIALVIQGEATFPAMTYDDAQAKAEKLTSKNPTLRVTGKPESRLRPIRICKTKPVTTQDENKSQRTTFNIEIIVEEEYRGDSRIKTPRKILTRIFDILERFPSYD